MDSFCVRFWTALDITAHEGHARPCCLFKFWLEEGNPPLVGDCTFDEALNSPTFTGWRQKSLAGQSMAGCEICHAKERDGSQSDRFLYNQSYTADHGTRPEEVFVEANPGNLLPLSLSLHLGNLCNLKCRMCGPQSSSRIAADPVHMGWALRNPHQLADRKFNRSLFDDPERLIEKISRSGSALIHLHVSGGEPLIMPNMRRLFEHLIEAGHAGRIQLAMPSNGTKIDPAVLTLLARFKKVNVRLSIDGAEPVDEYIRYPSKWAELTANIELLKTLPNVRLSVGFTLSAYNVFEPVKVCTWAVARHMHFEYGFVEHPHYLNPSVLPGPVLQQAADRIATFLNAQDPHAPYDFVRDFSFNQLRGIGHYLAQSAQPRTPAPKADPLKEFFAFTEDLDRDRGQRLAQACPELWEALDREKTAEWTAAPDDVTDPATV